MGLFARITADDDTKIRVHPFCSAIREWAHGGATRAQVIAAFGLAGDDVTQLDALAGAYTSLPANNAAAVLEKAAYLYRIEDVFILCEAGLYTESVARARLGF